MAARFTRVACLAAKQAARTRIDSGSCSALQRPFLSPRAIPQSFSCRIQGVLQHTLKSQVLHSGAACTCMHANASAAQRQALLPRVEASLDAQACAGTICADTAAVTPRPWRHPPQRRLQVPGRLDCQQAPAILCPRESCVKLKPAYSLILAPSHHRLPLRSTLLRMQRLICTCSARVRLSASTCRASFHFPSSPCSLMCMRTLRAQKLRRTPRRRRGGRIPPHGPEPPSGKPSCPSTSSGCTTAAPPPIPRPRLLPRTARQLSNVALLCNTRPCTSNRAGEPVPRSAIAHVHCAAASHGDRPADCHAAASGVGAGHVGAGARAGARRQPGAGGPNGHAHHCGHAAVQAHFPGQGARDPPHPQTCISFSPPAARFRSHRTAVHGRAKASAAGGLWQLRLPRWPGGWGRRRRAGTAAPPRRRSACARTTSRTWASRRDTTRSSRCWATSPSATTSRRTQSSSHGSCPRRQACSVAAHEQYLQKKLTELVLVCPRKTLSYHFWHLDICWQDQDMYKRSGNNDDPRWQHSPRRIPLRSLRVGHLY